MKNIKMLFKYRLYFFVIFISILIASISAGADNVVGRIDKTSGRITVIRSDNTEIFAEKGTPLYAGDRIVTGKNESVNFTVDRIGQFRLGEDAEISIDELSALKEDETPPVLQLVVGYLRSTVKALKSEKSDTSIHTPTAIIGVRGTIFDTVVSLDSSTVIAVDEGEVELDADGEIVSVGSGMMTQFEPNMRLSAPVRAEPPEKRDWKNWRRKREDALVKKIPEILQHLRRRFDVATDVITHKKWKMDNISDYLFSEMKNARYAKQNKKLRDINRSVERIRKLNKDFISEAVEIRKGINKFKAISRLSERLEKLAVHHKHLFDAGEWELMRLNLNTISQRQNNMESQLQQTIDNIRNTFISLREFRQDIRNRR